MAKVAEYHGNLSKGILTLEIIMEKAKHAENEYMEIKKKVWVYREIFVPMLIEDAEGEIKQLLKKF